MNSVYKPLNFLWRFQLLMLEKLEKLAQKGLKRRAKRQTDCQALC